MEGLSRACGRGLGMCEGVGPLPHLWAPPATPTWLCFGIRDHFAQALELEKGCLQSSMGPLEVSREAFNWEEERLLDGDGECGRSHRCGAGP